MWRWLTYRLLPALVEAPQRWSNDNGFLLCAAMSYYASLSIFPLCLLLIAGLGYVMRFSEQAQFQQQQLIEVVADNFSPAVAQQLDSVLGQVKDNAGIGGPIGLLTLLVTAIGIFYQFDNIMAQIWGTPAPTQRGLLAAARTALIDRLAAFAMLLGIGLLLIVVFLADMVLVGVRSYAGELPGVDVLWPVLQTTVSLAMNALLFATIYKVLPKAKVRWSDALAGGVLVAVTWLIGQKLLAMFVIGEKYTAYGVVGSFIAIMLWIYYASAVIFLGAEVVQSLCATRQRGHVVLPGQPAASIADAAATEAPRGD